MYYQHLFEIRLFLQRHIAKQTRCTSAAFLPILALFFISCGSETEQTVELLRPVRYQEVLIAEYGQSRTFSGVSKAGVETKLSFKVAGTISSLPVKVGVKVRSGQLIAALDNTDYQLQLEQADLVRKNAKDQKKISKSNFERITALFEDNNVSQSDYESAKSAYENAKSAHKQAKAQRDLARRQLGYTRLYAPMAGIISQVYVEKNENITPGKTIVELTSGNESPEVTIGIPESYISEMNEGDSVTVVFSSLDTKQYDGIITEVSYAISDQSSTYPVIIKLVDPSPDVRPGMSCQVTFKFKEKNEDENGDEMECIEVPPSAVSQDQKGHFVFLVKPHNGDTAIVERKNVGIGELSKSGIEITEGLNNGDLIVTAGISKLYNGMKVKMLK